MIYSYTCHEGPEAFIDTLRNLIYYNKGLRIAIVVHCNPYMHARLTEQLRALKLSAPVLLNDTVSNKRMYTSDILVAQCQNISFCHRFNLRARYIIPMASNCYFHKDVTLELLEEYARTDATDIIPGIDPDGSWSGWKPLTRNPKILNILERDFGLERDQYHCQSHEGQILEYDAAVKIAQCVLTLPFEEETMFEESLLASLYCAITKRRPAHRLTHIFWNRASVAPSIEDILQCKEPCVKRVSREYTDPVRVWQRGLTGDYVA